MSCSICLDTFRNPKLLPCLHTFCRKCLENHAKCKIVNGQANKMNCPLCRHTVCIPTCGINKLFSNYFVKDRRFSPKNICEECNKSVMDTCCHLCDDFLCLDCGRNHQCDFKCTTTDFVSSDPESDDDDDEETEIPLQLRFMLSDFHWPVTKMEANVVRKFSVFSDSRRTARVTSVLPLRQGGAYIVIDQGPDIIRFDKNYNRTETIQTAHGIRDIAYGLNGRIYLLQETSSIQELRGKKVHWFATLPDTIVHAMSFFPDGRFVVLAVQDTPELFRNREGKSMVIILDRNGHINSVLRPQIGVLTAVVAIPNQNCICTFDYTRGCLLFLLCDGTFLKHYMVRIQQYPSMSDHLGLIRKELCCDGDGNVLLYDRVSGSLHLLNSYGELIGLINTKSPVGLGSPGTIRVAPDGDFWIGDSENHTIRILKTSRFKNSFRLPDSIL